MTTADQFCEIRAKAIADYGAGRKTKWTVLGAGRFGKLGALRVLDQFGHEGLVVQSEPGSEIGMPMGGTDGYQEVRQLAN